MCTDPPPFSCHGQTRGWGGGEVNIYHSPQTHTHTHSLDVAMEAIPSIPQTDKCRIVAHRLSGPKHSENAACLSDEEEGEISSVSLNYVGRLSLPEGIWWEKQGGGSNKLTQRNQTEGEIVWRKFFPA